MPRCLPNVAILATLLLLSACRPQVMPAETAVPPSQTPDGRPVATLGPDDAVPGAIIAIEPVVIVPPKAHGSAAVPDPAPASAASETPELRSSRDGGGARDPGSRPAQGRLSSD